MKRLLFSQTTRLIPTMETSQLTLPTPEHSHDVSGIPRLSRAKSQNVKATTNVVTQLSRSYVQDFGCWATFWKLSSQRSKMERYLSKCPIHFHELKQM